MAMLRRTRNQTSRFLEQASQSLRPHRRWSGRRLIGPAVGVVALVATAWLLPEVVRYIKLERM
jgi:hypothetical protein